MIRGTDRSRKQLYLGLSGECVTRLVGGEALTADMRSLGVQVELCLFYGRTSDDLTAQLRERGLPVPEVPPRADQAMVVPVERPGSVPAVLMGVTEDDIRDLSGGGRVLIFDLGRVVPPVESLHLVYGRTEEDARDRVAQVGFRDAVEDEEREAADRLAGLMPREANERLPALEAVQAAYRALGIPDDPAEVAAGEDPALRRALLLARAAVWAFIFADIAATRAGLTLTERAGLHQQADLHATGGDDAGRGMLVLQLGRVAWLQHSLVECKGPVSNPVGDAALGAIESTGMLVQAWLSAYENVTGQPGEWQEGVVDPAKLGAAAQHLAATLTELTEAGRRAPQAGDTGRDTT